MARRIDTKDEKLEKDSDVYEQPVMNSESDSEADHTSTTEPQAESDSETASVPEQDIESPSEVIQGPHQSRFKRFCSAFWAKKQWTLPLTLLLVIVIILAVPFSRYKVLGLFMKQQVTIEVIDSASKTPVSGATVKIAGQTFHTGGSGKAIGQAKLGDTQLVVEKQYYKPHAQAVKVTLSKTENTYKVSLQATGRQVPLTLVNKLTGKGIADVTITILDTEAKTDKDGKATVVVPISGATQKATLQRDGFNTVTADIQVTDKKVDANTFSLTPAGKLYFLSNRSGKLDVVKTNLDGTDRQVVLAGTGTEDARNTSLLASRDWKYLALLSKRSAAGASVYLIDTTNADKLTTIDEGKDVTFSFNGWSNSIFVYQVFRDKAPATQPTQAIKSYNAITAKLTTIDQPIPLASEPNLRQAFGSPYLVDDKIVYAKNWSAVNTAGTTQIIGKQAELATSKVDGSAKRVAKAFGFPAGSTASYDLSIATRAYAPGEVYIYFAGGAKEAFYEYENDQVKDAPATVTNDTFWNVPYPTYLQSPSGGQTFWTELRDGKDALFIGDKAGHNEKQIAALSEYTPFGWHSDNYLLVAKKSSELYILPVDGSAAPQKITDYYKPSIDYRGYGGGYGGL